mgnify:CR=1 FL=1
MKKRNVSFRIPEEFSNIRVEEPMDYAAGKLGVKVALEHTFKEMGVVKALKGLAQLNQPDGYACMSCAWPDPKNPSSFAEYCENGAKALSEEATNYKVGPEFFAKYSVEEISTWSDFKIGKSGRITHPMVLRPGSIHYEPISYEAAFQLIAEELQKMDTPEQGIFYTSGRSSNEAAFLYGLFVRALGSNNMPDCSNMCHESSGKALVETLGIGKGSVKLEDLYEAEVIIIAGQNPGTNHPRMLSALEKCKENGGKIISINPLEEAGLVRFKNPQNVKGVLGGGEDMADIHLPVKINQDIALVKLIIKKLALLDEKDHNIFDHDFINTYTEGYKALLADVEKYDENELLKQCGVSENLINLTVGTLAKKSKIIVCWAMGLTQHKNGVENIKEYVNLLMLKGSLGKSGAGTCPVRGHSNVQGDRSVGIMHYIDEDVNKAIEEQFGFEPSDKEGVDVVQAMQAMHDGKTKVFMALGGNFLMATSDTEYTAQAIENCELTVQVSTKLNRTHLVTGKTALIIPTLGRSEKDEKDGKRRYFTIENSMGQVRQSKGILKPADEGLMSEPEIIAGIAEAYYKGDHPVNWQELGTDYDLLRDKIDLIAAGFVHTSKDSVGTGYYLPNNVRDLDFSMMPNGRAQFSINSLPKHDLKEDELLLMTIRSHDQFNTTIYGLNDRYRGIYNERRVVFMNPEDMKARSLTKLDIINIKSNYDGKERKTHKYLVIPYKIPRGNIAAYFPETNVLVPYNHYADKSNTPISKSVVVKVEKYYESVEEVTEELIKEL